MTLKKNYVIDVKKKKNNFTDQMQEGQLDYETAPPIESFIEAIKVLNTYDYIRKCLTWLHCLIT